MPPILLYRVPTLISQLHVLCRLIACVVRPVRELGANRVEKVLYPQIKELDITLRWLSSCVWCNTMIPGDMMMASNSRTIEHNQSGVIEKKQ